MAVASVFIGCGYRSVTSGVYKVSDFIIIIIIIMSDLNARTWCFTLNFDGDSSVLNIDRDFNHPSIRYVIFQHEKVSHDHFQGYIELKSCFRRTSLVKAIPKLRGAHLAGRLGTRDEARNYCRKEETRVAGPWEKGSFDSGGQGKRSDCSSYATRVVELAKAGERNWKRVMAEEMPGAHLKFAKHGQTLYDDVVEAPTDEEFVPRPWQQELLERVAVPANDRSIVWVRDSKGNTGKSRLARHLILEHQAVQLNGRMLDMAYMFNFEKVVIFDISRAQAEFSNHCYSMAESLKNGCVISTKYEPKTKLFKPPHVIFFSNSLPDNEKWSEDRLILIDLDVPRPNPVDVATALRFM